MIPQVILSLETMLALTPTSRVRAVVHLSAFGQLMCGRVFGLDVAFQIPGAAAAVVAVINQADERVTTADTVAG